MKSIKEITRHEMLRRWAVGEIYVEFLNSEDKQYSLESLKLLNSANPVFEKKGIERTLKLHHMRLVSTLSLDMIWYTARLEIKEDKFNELFMFPVPDLARISRGTYHVATAASVMQRNPALNPRITSILTSFKEDKDQVQLSGITLIAQDFNGPYTVIEGNGRLVSIYIAQLLEGAKILGDEIEVVLGIYVD